MLKNYIITALRNLWRNKFFSFINIFGLSLGIACCMLIFLYAKDETSFDRFHKKGEQIYHLTLDMIDSKGEVSYTSSTGMMPGPTFKKNIPEIEDFVRIQFASCDIQKNKDVLWQDALWVDENFLSVFTFPVLFGNAINPLKDLHSVVISEDLAKKYFGKSDVVGKTLHMNADTAFSDFTVTAVLKNSPINSSIKAQMLLPIKLHQLYENDTEWMNSFLNTFVVLKPGSDLKIVAAKCNSIYQSEAAIQIKEMREKYEFDDKYVYHLQALSDMHLDTNYVSGNGLSDGSNPVYSYILVGIAAFILLIACINFVNLTVARSLKRAKEIGIRKVVGSQRKQLILQFLGESFVMSLFSFVFAILLVVLVLPFFNSVSGKELSFSYLFDIELILGYSLLFLLTGFLAGSYPALVLSGFNPVETLYGKLRFSGKNYLSKSLVVLQFTLASFFIIATLAIYSQFNFMIHYDLGYEKENIISVLTGNMTAFKLQSVKNELQKEPAIQRVSGRQGGERYTLAHVNGTVNLGFKMDKIDEESFSLLKIPVVMGRNFSKEFPSDSIGSAMVNEKFVKEAGWKNPIGEIVDFHYSNKKYSVIGVVKNFQNGPLSQELKSQFFTMDPQMHYNLLYVKINPAGRTAALRHIEKTIKTMFPATPYQYSFLDDTIYKQYESEEKWKKIVAFSALLTIFISCIGLFGMAALSAERRAKEMGIRKVLGASARSIIQNLSSDFLKLIFIAACISVPAAWWAINKWLELYAYRMSLKPALFVLPICLIVLLALITVSYQSIRAALSNPVTSLRSE
ncbi:antibiotic ABC transporter permease [Sphingobacteriaceae bacterium]|nr:antibiotic ABC transporter permease [Sphingobacteriaceae bacterium]